MTIDPNKTTLNDILNPHRSKAGVVIYPPEGIDGAELTLLYDGVDNTLWVCWTGNGSIYLEDRP